MVHCFYFKHRLDIDNVAGIKVFFLIVIVLYSFIDKLQRVKSVTYSLLLTKCWLVKVQFMFYGNIK